MLRGLISILGTVVGAGVLAAMPGVGVAHHSFAGYDLERVVVIEGTVATYEWRNPHVELGVRDLGGRLWVVETDAPPTMAKSGWSPDSFQRGDAVTVRFNPGKAPGASTGLLIAARGANWVERSSVARSGVPSRAAAIAISALALLATALTAARARVHRAPGPPLMAGVAGVWIVWTTLFAFGYAALACGVALLVAAGGWTALTDRRRTASLSRSRRESPES